MGLHSMRADTWKLNKISSLELHHSEYVGDISYTYIVSIVGGP